MHQEHLLEREMPLSLHIASRGMVFVLLLGRRVRQLAVATSILGASAMLHCHVPCRFVITLRYTFLQRYMGVGYSPLYIYILLTLAITLNIIHY